MDQPSPAATSARTTHILYLAPPDAARLARLAMPAVSAAAVGGADGLRTLILVDDASAAVTVATHAADEVRGGLAPIIALTAAARAQRIIRGAVPGAVAVPITVAAELMTRASLPLGGVRHVFLAMPSAAEDRATLEAIDAVLAGVPKTAVRTLVAPRETPAVEALAERHFFKPRRIRESDPSGAHAAAPFAVRVIAATSGTRWTVVRRLLDEIDPPSAAIVTADAATHAEAERALAALGYGAAGAVQATRDVVAPGTALAVLIGVPGDAALRSAQAAGAVHVVVVCDAAEIASVRGLPGVSLSPWTFDAGAGRARSREAATRARLREILGSGSFARELLWLSPLLDEFDASEIAAAALVIASEVPHAAAPPPAGDRPPSPGSRPPSRPPHRPSGERDRRPPPRGRDDRPREPRRFDKRDPRK